MKQNITCATDAVTVAFTLLQNPEELTSEQIKNLSKRISDEIQEAQNYIDSLRADEEAGFLREEDYHYMMMEELRMYNYARRHCMA